MPCPPMKTVRVVVVLALACLPSSACGGASATQDLPAGPTLTPALGRALQGRLNQKVTESGAPGASAAIVFPDGREWSGAVGYADSESQRAMTPATTLPFGETTEIATTALVMRLVELGDLRLDDPIQHWYGAWRGDPNATVRDLLGHTSGIGDPDNAFFQALLTHPERVLSERRYLAATPRPGPRTAEARISEAGYMIAGLIAAHVAHEPIAVAMRRIVLAAPGGSGLALQPGDRPHDPAGHAYWYPHGVNDPVDLSDGSSLLPSRSWATLGGSAFGLAGDVPALARWGHATLGGHLVSPGSLQAMTRFHPIPGYEGYGLGTMRDSLDGRIMWGRLAHVPGAHTELWHLPRQDLTIAIAWNDDLIDHDSGFVRALLRTALSGSKATR